MTREVFQSLPGSGLQQSPNTAHAPNEKSVYICEYVCVCVCVLGLEGTCFCLFGGGLYSGADLGVGFKFCCLFHTVGSAPECLSFHPDLF